MRNKKNKKLGLYDDQSDEEQDKKISKDDRLFESRAEDNEDSRPRRRPNQTTEKKEEDKNDDEDDEDDKDK